MFIRSFRFRLAALCVGLLLLSSLPFAQEPRPQAAPDDQGEARLLAAMHGISSETVFDYVKEMAAPKYQGRLTGTASYDAIAKWTADLLTSWKIKPAGYKWTFYQKFANPYTLVLPGGSLSRDIKLPNGDIIKRPYVFEEEYYPGSTSDSGTIQSVWRTPSGASKSNSGGTAVTRPTRAEIASIARYVRNTGSAWADCASRWATRSSSLSRRVFSCLRMTSVS